MQNRDIWFRISSLYGSQTSTMVFPFKTAWLAPELLVFMCPRPHLSFCTSKKNVINIVITSLYGSQPSSVVFAGKTATFGSELKVSMGPRHHLGFFCRKNNVNCIRITFLYGSQSSPIVLSHSRIQYRFPSNSAMYNKVRPAGTTRETISH